MPAQSECPRCGALGVRCRDSRPSTHKDIIRRRIYSCDQCNARWNTHEILAEQHIPDAVQGLMLLRDLEAVIRKYLGDEKKLRGALPTPIRTHQS